MSLHDDQPLDLKEERALKAALALPEQDRKSWWAGLPDTTRKAIMQKLVGALAKAEAPRDIGSLARSLMTADRLDIEREKLAQGPAQNNHLHVNAPAEMFREILVEVRNANAPQHHAEADSEPAGDD